MTLKLVEWKSCWVELILLDTIETKTEWNAMTADADRTIGYLIGRDVEDDNQITIIGEDLISEMVAV